MTKLILAVPVYLYIAAVSVRAQQSSNKPKAKPPDSATQCSMHDAHSQVNDRGEQGMGFSQTATTHHFLLKPDGGVIQVEANSAQDTVNRDNIRMHLMHIAQAFARGDFDIPMFVHDTVPPGVPEMRRSRKKILYSFEETPTGGRVVMVTTSKESLAAIHKFLRFQIEEHQTGDLTTIP